MIQPIAAFGASLLNPSAASAQGNGGSLLGSSAGLLSAGQSLWGAFSGAASMSAGGLVSTFGNLIGSSAVSSFGAGMGMSGSAAASASSAYAGAGMATEAGAISAGSSVGAAIPYVAAAIAAYYVATKGFGHGDRQITGENVTAQVGSSGVTGTHNVEHVKEGGWFSSDIRGSWNYDLNSGVTMADGVAYNDTTGKSQSAGKAIKAGFDALAASSTSFAKSLGLNADFLKTKQFDIKFDFGKDDNEFVANLSKALGGVADTIATQLIPNIAEFSKKGETAGSAFQRIAADYTAVDAVIETLGKTSEQAFGAIGTASIAARERLVDLAGGLDKFQGGAAYFAQNFLSEADQLKPTIDGVAKKMSELGLANVTTIGQFAGVVKGLDMTSEAGAKQYTELMQLAPAFKTVADYMSKLNGTTGDTALTIADTVAVMKQKSSFEIQIMELSGDAAGALAAKRKIELDALDASVRPLQQRVYALQDEKAAADALSTKNQSIQSQIDSLINASLTKEQLHAKELAGQDASTVALYKQLYALQDKAEAEKAALAAQQAAQQAAEHAAQAAAQLTAAWQSVTDSIFSEVARIRGLISGGGPSTFASAQTQFAITTAQARAGDQDAARLLPQLSQTLLQLAEQNATSALELNRIRAQTAASLAETGNSFAKYGVKLPSATTGGSVAAGVASGAAFARITAESGPELDTFSQSRIFDANQTRAMLSGGNDPLVTALIDEVRELRNIINQLLLPTQGIEKNTRKMKDNLQRVTHDGEEMQTRILP